MKTRNSSKNLIKSLILTLVFLMLKSFSIAQPDLPERASTGTSVGTVLIIAMTITESAPMHFGSNVMTNTLGGTVVLPSNSIIRSYTSGVAGSAATPVPTNATFNVTGTGLETYALTLPAATTVTHTTVAEGVYTMTISQMTARFDGASNDAIISTLSSEGYDSFTLGGTLTVQADQVGGIYAGTFDVTVDYN